ncbi:synaptic vesicle glycoprotein 2B-like isoform X1 [Schistocerca gregaria]|uniref:synaptic vesicle glycoprotein 2B-like isoform X1 n=1 Tax=Schistocerca gregaria TaxID=7010 RepID=UPI00211ED1E3|nr:synaptic vesicle glycoprotein 2B-like isoform X1 [Schistocerca gregaria]
MGAAEDKERAENGVANADVGAETPFEVAVALTGQGRFHLTALTVCGFCLMTLIFESLAAAYVTPAAQCDFDMSSFEKGFLSGTIYIGMIVSSHLWGFVADTRGRRRVLSVTLAANSACSVVAAFMPSLPLLIFLRLLNGIFICGPSAVTYAYLGEFHGEKTRTQSMVYVCVFIALASVAQPALAWVVIPQPWDVALGAVRLRSWRVFLLLGAALSAITFTLLRLFMPESPKFLLVAGRRGEALDVLRHMFATNNGVPPDKFPVTALQRDSQSVSSVGVNTKSPAAIARHMWRQTAPLFRPPYLLYTLLACLLQFGLYASSNGFLLWLPDLVTRMSQYNMAYPGQETTVCDVIAILAGQMPPPADVKTNYSSVLNMTTTEPWTEEATWMETTVTSGLLENSSAPILEAACSASISSSSFQNTLIIGVGMAVSFASVTLLLRVVSKKTIIAVCLAVSGACGVSMIWAQTELQILLLPMAFIVLSGMCIAVVNSVVVDIFPTYLRAMAVCLSLCCGRLGTFITSLMLGALIDSSCILAIAILGGFVFACGVLSTLLPSEAKLKRMNH